MQLGLKLLVAPVGYWRFWPNAFVLEWQRCLDGKDVLDVSSPKLLSLVIAAGGANVTATDLDDSALMSRWSETANVLGVTGYRAEYQDARKLPYRDSSFDLVYSISVVEHIPGNGDTTAVCEMVRVLRPGGVAIVEVPFRQLHHEYFRHEDSKGTPVSGAVFYERHYDRSTLKRLLPEMADADVYVLGERLPVDRFISGVAIRLPRWLRVTVCPFEPLLAAFNYSIGRATGSRPLAALLVLRKPRSAS